MLFRKKIDPSCSYCAYCTQLDEEQVLCIKKGVKPTYAKCRKFQYDPVKRVPKKPKALNFSRFDKDDFSLI